MDFDQSWATRVDADPVEGEEPSPGGSALRVLVVLGHPRADSLCGGLAGAYAAGARAAGVAVRTIQVGGLAFDPDVREASSRRQSLEVDLEAAQRLILWADHLAFVFPSWWGTMPARLKGFLDRILTPGFAFDEITGGIGYAPRLGGRTAELLVTMDTPSLAHRLVYRSPALNAMKRATLGFCGVEAVRTRLFDRVKERSAGERAAWLEEAWAQGHRLGRGPRTSLQRLQASLRPWVEIARLQFYPMTWLAYLMGALAAAGSFDLQGFGLGLLFLIALEFATVLINEVVDLESDRRNRYWGPFTGGSRVLVEGRLGRWAVQGAAAAGIGVAALAAAAALAVGSARADLALVLAALAVLAIGYTLPPLKLSWRTLGEIDVALTHGLLATLMGFVVQGGRIGDPLPWLLGLPLTLAVLPSIILAGVPDRTADAAVGKRTVAVRLGVPAAVRLAQASAGLAALAALLMPGRAGALLHGIAWLALPHAGWLIWRLNRAGPWHDEARRIDGLLVLALTYMVWFALVPLVHLAFGWSNLR